MNSFNNSFVSEMTKLAQPGSGVSPLSKALALGGAGVGAYGLYKAHAANQAAQQAAAAAQQAASSRRRNLLALGLIGGGAVAANHFGLDAGIIEKLKGLFGGGAAPAEAANPITSALSGGKTVASNLFEKMKAGHFTPPNYAPMPIDQVAPMTAGPSVAQTAASALKSNPVVGQLKSILGGNQVFQGPDLPPNLSSGNLTTMAPGSDFATANFDTPINYDSSGRAVLPFKDGGYMRSAFNPMPF
jgi:hypothetical protein